MQCCCVCVSTTSLCKWHTKTPMWVPLSPMSHVESRCYCVRVNRSAAAAAVVCSYCWAHDQLQSAESQTDFQCPGCWPELVEWRRQLEWWDWTELEQLEWLWKETAQSWNRSERRRTRGNATCELFHFRLMLLILENSCAGVDCRVAHSPLLLLLPLLPLVVVHWKLPWA